MDHTVSVQGGVWLTCHIQNCQLEPLSRHSSLSARGPVAPARNKEWGENNTFFVILYEISYDSDMGMVKKT